MTIVNYDTPSYLRLVNTHPWTSTAAMFLDSKWNLPDFYASRTKRQVNAFIIYMFPTVKPLLMSNSSHPLRASALTDSHKGRTLRSADGYTLHQPIRFRTWLTLANLWRNIENANIIRKFFFWILCRKDVLLCCVSQSSLKSMNFPQTTYRPHRGLNRPHRNSKIS